jgi:hypothetical protein
LIITDRRYEWADADHFNFIKNLNRLTYTACYGTFLFGMIKYQKRYSFNNEYDHMGRWARIAYFRNIHIAWINRLENKGKTLFSVSLHFPTMQNDTANDHKVCYSLEEAKEFVKERWEWFINEVR